MWFTVLQKRVTQVSAKSSRVALKPLCWWELLNANPRRLPFIGLYLELLGGGFKGQRVRPEEENSMYVDNRIVEPVEGWEQYLGSRSAGWGDDQGLIEDWFDAGDALQFQDTLFNELKIDEPDRWERARDWVRSLLVA